MVSYLWFPGKSQRRKQRADNKALREAIASGEVDLEMGDDSEAAGVQEREQDPPEPAAAAASMQQ